MAAAGLAMVPLLIHLLNRRRYRDEPWAAMQFILSAVQRTRRRLRTEQWILLAVRTVVMALVGLAVARPYLKPKSALLSVGERRVDRVIVLDDSLSMRAGTSAEPSALEVAKSAIDRLMERSAGSGGFALVTASRPARAWFDQPVQDRLAVRQAVESIGGTWAASDLHGALEQADAILSRSTAPPEAREIYVFSDFCERDLKELPGSAESPFAPVVSASRIVLFRSTSGSRPNRAVTDLRVVGQPALLNGAAEIRAEVTNFSTHEMAATALSLHVAGREAGRKALGPLAGGGKATVEFHIALAPGAVHVIEAMLNRSDEDWLPDDDRRRLAVDVPPRWRVLLVETRAAHGRSDHSLFYYQLALGGIDSAPSNGSPFDVTQVEPVQFRDVVLKDYDVVVVADWATLQPGDFERLRRFVTLGGGLIAFCGTGEDEVSAATLNGILPVRLLDVYQAPTDAPPPTLMLADPRHPVLGDFAGQQRNILGRAHVTAWRRIQPEANESRLDRVIDTSSGDPVLLTAEVGSGRIALWLTSADMSWTNFPAKPDFLPLMMNLTGFVAGDRNSGRNVLVGEALSGRVSLVESGRIEFTLPDKTRQRAEPDRDEWGGRWKLRDTAEPGVYEWTRGAMRDAYCVNVDTAESDLRRADSRRVAQAFGDRSICVDSSEPAAMAGETGVREWGWMLAVILLLTATTESLLGRLFGGVR